MLKFGNDFLTSLYEAMGPDQNNLMQEIIAFQNVGSKLCNITMSSRSWIVQRNRLHGKKSSPSYNTS